MPLRGVDLITDIGEAKLIAAAGSNTAVAITTVAIGDGNGTRYAPASTQTTLRNELARQPIDSRALIGNSSYRTKVVFDSDTPAINVREIGFFDAVGDMIFLWAGTDIAVRQTGAIDYVLDHVLNFSRIADGLVIVEAPDDLLTSMQVEQVTQNNRLTALESEQLTLPGALYWVDQATGSDDNTGSAANPLASIGEACARMVPGGQHIINLMAAYYWTTRDVTRASDIILRSNPGGPQWPLTFGSEATNRPNSSPGFLQFSGGFQLAVNNIDVRLSPLLANVLPVEPSIIRTTAFPRIKFLNCNFTLLPNADQSIVNGVTPQDLYIENCTFPSEMAGRWIAGASAGASPAARPHLRTNLSSL